MTNTLQLEQRIASALSDEITSATVAALIDETEGAIAEADATAAAERLRALDPTQSPDPVAARETMQAAAFARDRLHVLMPRLQQRWEEMAAREELAAWHEQAGPLTMRRERLAAELAEVYPRAVDQLIDILTHVRAFNAEARRHGGAPDGSGGVPGIDVHALADQLRLPRWGNSKEWPLPGLPSLALVSPRPGGDPRRFTGEWYKVKEEEAAAAREQRERDEREQLARALSGPGPHWWACRSSDL